MRQLIAVAFAAITILGCDTAGEGDRAGPAGHDLTAADSAYAIRAGEPVATAVAQGLAGRLQEQIATRGAAGAVDFCATTALALTESLAAAAGPGIEVKRTSSRTRNPRNAPDALERKALAWFESAHASSGAIPPHYVQADTGGAVRFYRPLVIAPLCTQCHGDPASMDSAVARVLRERYPEDRATGYRPGDLRGVLRVSLPGGGEAGG